MVVGGPPPRGKRPRMSKAVSARPSSDIARIGQPKMHDGDIDAAEHEGAAAHAARDRVQHGEAEDRVGHEQARGEHARQHAEQAGQERADDRGRQQCRAR